jgi:cytoskeleton protein RodZ
LLDCSARLIPGHLLFPFSMYADIGQELRQARQSKALSIEQASRSTRIRVHYLRAIERGDLDALPSMAQARGFLRLYADYLGLDVEKKLKSLDNAQAELVTPLAQEEMFEPPAEEKPRNTGPTGTNGPVVSSPEPAQEAPHPEIPQAARDIFDEVGQKLRRQRELLGLSLEDVARHTHLRQHYLQALEDGDLAGLPSPVQGRGMLKNYAVFLGMDAEALLLRFADGLQARLAIKQAPRKAEAERATRPRRTLPSPLRRLFSVDVLAGVGLVVFLSVFAIWGGIRILDLGSQSEVSPTAPSIAAVLLAAPTSTPTPSPEPSTPTPPLVAGQGGNLASTQPLSGTLQIPSTGDQPVQVYITVNQRAWMRVTVDGKVQFDGRVIPGSAYSFAGKDAVEVLTGDGAALQVFFNQQDLGAMGNFGQVVDQIYTQEGVLAPTPSDTPTASPTPRFTATPQPTFPQLAGTATVPALP